MEKTYLKKSFKGKLMLRNFWTQNLHNLTLKQWGSKTSFKNGNKIQDLKFRSLEELTDFKNKNKIEIYSVDTADYRNDLRPHLTLKKIEG